MIQSCIPLPMTFLIIFLGTSFIASCIYGVLRNPGEPTAMSDEDFRKETKRRNNLRKEIKIYLIIWAITFIIMSLILFVL